MLFKLIPSISWQALPAGATVIDVREPFEYKAYHAPQAKNIPLGKIDRYKPKGTVYLVCASGTRSKNAVRFLRKQGVDAINIKGGMSRYGK